MAKHCVNEFMRFLNADLAASGGRQPSDQVNWIGPWICMLAAIVHNHQCH